LVAAVEVNFADEGNDVNDEHDDDNDDIFEYLESGFKVVMDVVGCESFRDAVGRPLLAFNIDGEVDIVDDATFAS
jgi:hypothetical protein